MATFSFQTGARYTRVAVLGLVGMDPVPKWGPWVNGYFQYRGAHFIFCNVGGPGRTGHNYPNEFVGDDLFWTGKTKSRRAHPSIQRLIAPDSEVHIFFRIPGWEEFAYVGLARAVFVNDECPVGIRWRFAPADDEDTLAQDVESTTSLRPSSEGSMTTVRVNRYERSTAARAQCLAHFGTVCQACGIDFGVFYGAHGAGYIHVHHHLPLSSIKQSYVVDPIRDLVPVCANCHAMIHRRDPALTISELRALIRDARSDARGM